MNRGPLLKPSERTNRTATRTRNISRYEILKDKIRTWWNDRLAIGEALREIRDSKLYKDEYPNFEDFCTDEFGIKHSQAYRLIAAAEVKASVTEGDKPSPMGERIVNERQARALAAVPEESRVEVLESAVRENGNLTAKAITEAAETIAPKTESAVPGSEPVAPSAKPAKEQHLDKTGHAIPDLILDDWREAEAHEELLKQVHRIKLRVEKALEDRELVFREITNSTVADLQNAWSALQGLIPHAVCPSCEGFNRENCTLCRQRGFLSKFAYLHYVPEKTRKIREAISA